MSKIFGEGIFNAFRQDGIVHVVATGQKPTPQTKVTIEEQPFLIYPPRFALFFETDGITIPMMLPFQVERAFPNYPNENFISIVDKNGLHTIDIVEKAATGSAHLVTDATIVDFVVYQQIGTDRYLIAKSDAIVIAVYHKVFGPDTLANCQAYVAAHTATIVPSPDIVPNSLHAWINRQPGTENGSKLIVVIEAIVGLDWTVTLVSAVPQGFNPLIKLLRFDVQLPAGSEHSHARLPRKFRYEESPAHQNYTDVTIESRAGSTSTTVENVT